ncbi:Leukotriene A-4 hydrolase [Cichlidogyrus casuarinus]|uniref:Leukotriene A-4 hydrolase n=1 Tax=Cichlidogyrus casuarinus TaxID=1844966 RepID=A0ABD2PVP4_9PLAT
MENDHASVADLSCHRLESAHFHIDVKSEEEIFDISLKYVVSCLQPKKSLYLDMENLHIIEVLLDGERSDWSVKEHKAKQFGSALVIPCNSDKNQVVVEIKFQTDKKACSAVQWLPASSTAGKKLPFFFSQCQAINARSLYPCQDTPGSKFTYTAEVHAPANIAVLLAAVRKSEPTQCNEHDECKVYNYAQEIPVPSYLFAIAGGDITGKKIGPRSTVWAEPSLVEAAAHEFAETENMLSTAEKLCGPYEWGVYDILVPPASFPFGGMENPCLTYVTPAIIAGDRSLDNVIAHEISHSWTGNLVTNSTWEHFWLNEGHTDYLERLIVSELQGEQVRLLHICIGLEELRESVEAFGHEHEFTKLVPNLHNVHPDDSYSRVPYEKGSLLLYHLETVYGKDKMITWLKAYLQVQFYFFKTISFLNGEYVYEFFVQVLFFTIFFYKPTEGDLF